MKFNVPGKPVKRTDVVSRILAFFGYQRYRRVIHPCEITEAALSALMLNLRVDTVAVPGVNIGDVINVRKPTRLTSH